MKVSSELAQDRLAWNASVRDVVNSIGDIGSTRPGRMSTQVQVVVTPIYDVTRTIMSPIYARGTYNDRVNDGLESVTVSSVR